MIGVAAQDLTPGDVARPGETFRDGAVITAVERLDSTVRIEFVLPNGVEDVKQLGAGLNILIDGSVFA